jgi:hypothetical protein
MVMKKFKNNSVVTTKTWWMVLALALLTALFALPSSLGTLEAQDAADGDDNGDITFTKWVTTVPNMAGIAGGDVGTATFAGDILNFTPGTDFTYIEALYHITGNNHSFTAHVFVTENQVTRTAVIRGVVTDGWLKDRQVGGNYTIISCPGQTNGMCFQGTLHLTTAIVTAKIENAMSAAPISIAQDATILDNNVDTSGKYIVLREGTNGWTCFPNDPDTRFAPRCYDEVWMNWVYAAGAGDDPSLSVTAPGFAYMLAGGTHASLSDPSLAEPAAGDDWITLPPHIMIILSNTVDVSSIGINAQSTSPWMLYGNTPYHIIMIPTTDLDMEAMDH